jgi:hypothetical protein
MRNKQQIIASEWENLCDHVYDGENPVFPKESCKVYVPLDQIVRFFYECELNPHLKFVVVSAMSDYSLCYQHLYPVQADLKKWTSFIDFDKEVVGYEDLTIKARCMKHQCKITDLYSLRFYSFTGFTFDKIPDNIVRWYSTNCNVEHEKVRQIPFGIPEWTAGKLKSSPEKENKIYVNFEDNTVERVELKRNLQRHSSFLVKSKVGHEEYVDDISKCKFVLCPEGNGLDCFRTLESIYSGAVPIIVTNNHPLWSSVYEMPTISYKDLYRVLDTLVDELSQIDFNLDNPRFYLDFWQDELDGLEF